MSYKHTWGVPSTTSGWQNYPNGWVYTGGIPMPTARVALGGNQPIRIHSFGDYYATGAGSFMRFNYYGNIGEPGGVYTFGSSGGGFQWEAHQGNISNTMYFGRDRGAGRTVVSWNDGYVWDGTLAGSFYWDQVPAQLPIFEQNVVGRSLRAWIPAQPDDGGTTIDNYAIDITWNNWANLNTVYSTDYTWTNLTPGVTYQVRAHAHNAVGWGQTHYKPSFTVYGAGRRYTGSAWQTNTNAKRYSGSTFVDITIARRYTGSAWTDLTN